MAAVAGTMTSVTCSSLLKPICRQRAPRCQPVAAHRSALMGTRTALQAPSRRQQQRISSAVQAMIREYPDPDFIKEVEEAFPEKGIATVEEARALFSGLGWTYLDVRSALENEEVGKVKGSVNIPMVNSKKVFDPETKKKSIQKEPNEKFVEMVEKRFPDKENAKILIGCSNGRAYSMDALMALDEAGYQNLAGLKGGYYAWFRVFDNKLGRRRSGEYAETYTHDGDSCGIHSSGAGFDRVDKADQWVPQEY